MNYVTQVYSWSLYASIMSHKHVGSFSSHHLSGQQVEPPNLFIGVI